MRAVLLLPLFIVQTSCLALPRALRRLLGPSHHQPLSFCCRGSASRAARSRTSRHKHSVTPNLTSSPLKMVKKRVGTRPAKNAK